MGHFRYTPSEEDLKEQYRRLLIKYNYKDEKNKKVIDAITREYQQMVKQARYDNGYRTIGQKIKEKISEEIDKDRQEEDRKKALRSKKWTKQDMLNIVAEMKTILSKVIPLEIKNSAEITYRIRCTLAAEGRKKEIYDTCSSNISVVSIQDAVVFRGLQEKLEYCVMSLVGGNEEKSETVLRNIEDKLGQHVYEICLRHLPDEDPIEDLEIRRAVRGSSGIGDNKEALMKANNNVFAVLLSLPGVAAILLNIVFFYDMLSNGNLGELINVGNYYPIVLGIAWIFLMIRVRKANIRRIERRKRILGKEKNAKASQAGKLAYILSHLFR